MPAVLAAAPMRSQPQAAPSDNGILGMRSGLLYVVLRPQASFLLVSRATLRMMSISSDSNVLQPLLRPLLQF